MLPLCKVGGGCRGEAKKEDQIDASTQNRAALGKRVCGQPGRNCSPRTCPGSGLLWKGCVLGRWRSSQEVLNVPRSVSAAPLAHSVEVKDVCSHVDLPGFQFHHSHRLDGPYFSPLASVPCEVGLLVLAATFQGGCRDGMQDGTESLQPSTWVKATSSWYCAW